MAIENNIENIKKILAESYKNAISEIFKNEESFIDRNKSDENELSIDIIEHTLQDYLENYRNEKTKVMDLWAKTPIPELQGMTPSEIINGLNCFDDVYDVFLHMSENTDEELPDILIDKMRQYGAAMSEKLINLARSSAETDKQEHVFAETVSIIGRMGLSASVESLLQLLYDYWEDISKSEYLEDALKNLGEAVIEPILAKLEKNEFGEFEHRLLYVLASVGSKHKDERIYRIIRKAFREADEKLPVAVCIAAYNDGRAVPMLRSFLERNGRDIPDELFIVTLETLNELGGDITDFMGMLRERVLLKN
ncbi:MAG: hypothetical protein GX045_00630 [Clostridiaceae bacterium]|jgi:hypothetical protein|nr:hypothetical protein [Clostridiaceae bacterium]